MAQLTPEQQDKINAVDTDAYRSAAAKAGSAGALDPDLLAGIIDTLGNALTLGYGSEIEAALRAALPNVPVLGMEQPFEGATYKDRYNLSRQAREGRLDAFAEENPWTHGITNLAGLATGGFGLAKGLVSQLPTLAKTVSALPFIPRMAGIGAGEGFVYGTGEANPNERLSGGLEGAAWGTIGGPLIGGAMLGTGKVLRPTLQKLINAVTKTPKANAMQQVIKAIEADDVSLEEVATLFDQYGGDTILADLGANLRGLTRAAAAVPSGGKQIATEVLEARQKRQAIEVLKAAQNLAGDSPFDQAIIDTIARGASKSAEFYETAFGQVIQETPALSALLSRPTMISVLKKAEKTLRDEGLDDLPVSETARTGYGRADLTADVGPDSSLYGTNKIITVRMIDAAKRNLDDLIGAASRKGEREKVRTLTRLKNDILEIVDEQVPSYGQARSIYAGEASIRNAAEMGEKALNRNVFPDDLEIELQKMSEIEKDAFRNGFIKHVTNMLGNVGDTYNAANRLTQNQNLRQKLSLIFPNQDELLSFMNRMEGLQQQGITRQNVLGGSRTDINQITSRGAVQDTAALGLAGDVAVGMPIASSVRAMMRKLDENMDPQVAEELVKILTDTSIIPSNIRVPLPQRMSEALMPRLNPLEFSGMSGGVQAGLLQSALPQTNPEEGLLQFMKDN